MSAYGYESFVASKSSSSPLDAMSVIDVQALEDVSILEPEAVPADVDQSQIVPSQVPVQVLSVIDIISLARSEVEDISNPYRDAMVSSCMADEGGFAPMVLSSIAPTVVPTAVSTMLSDSHVRVPDGWNQRDVYESYGSDGWEADSNVGGDLSCKDDVHALYKGGDQVDHFWISLADDDFRHRRRGRGDQGTILVDYLDRRVSPVHQIDLVDQFDEFMEEDSVAYVIEFCDVGRSCREDDVLLREFEVDVQALQTELSHFCCRSCR